jgi:hypothetical protein
MSKHHISLNKAIILTTVSASLLATTGLGVTQAQIDTHAELQNTSKFYVGIQTGLGSTNWSGLDGHDSARDAGAVFLSAPKHSNDTGMVVGAFAGYKITRYLSVEANYIHLPDSAIQMGQTATFVGWYPKLPADGRFTSHTEAFDLTAHLRQEIFNTGIYAYGMAGAGYVYRHDIMSKRGTLSAAFGFGLDRKITKHINAEVNFTYITGQDKATVDPVNYYIPYIDTLNFGVSYQI